MKLATIQKWGNSLAVRIPRELARRLEIEAGTAVEIEAKENALVLKPKRRRKYMLEELLKNCKKGQLHGEVDLGPDVGRELID